jgi:hypothetical protein
MEACYRFSSGHYAFFIWQTIACVGNQKWNFPQFSIKARILVATRFGRTRYPLPGASEIQRAPQSKVRR